MMAVGFLFNFFFFGEIYVKRVPFFAIIGSDSIDKHTVFKALQKVRPHYEFPTEKWGTTTRNEFTNPFVSGLTDLIDSGIPREYATPRSLLKLCWSRLDTIIAENLLTAFQRGNGVIMRGFGAMALIRAMMRSTSDAERDELIHLHKQIVDATVLRAGAWAPDAYFHLRRDRTIQHTNLNPNQHEWKYAAKMDSLCKMYNTLPGQTVIPIDMERPIEVILAEVLGHIERIERELEFTVA